MSWMISRLFRFQVDQFLSRGITKGSFILLPAPASNLSSNSPADQHHPTTHNETKNIVFFGEDPTAAKAAGRPIATIQLVDADSFYARVLTQADIGFAEAYMAADFTVDSPEQLLNVFRVLILNRDEEQLSTTQMILSRIGTNLNMLLHMVNRNTLTGSKRNIEAHYDLSNELFGTFLGESWVYSGALFSDSEKLTLDQAQQRKIDHLVDKAHIEPGHHVLDIGCGWGQLAISIIERHPTCKVTGITLSEQQFVLAKRRAEDAGLSVSDDLNDNESQIRFVIIDYRDLVETGAKYDRVISIEMIEAVGHEFLGTYFSSIDQLMKKDGLAVIQAITIPDTRYDTYRTSTDFIQKHIFPGGLCPSLNAMSNAIAKDTSLLIDHVENIGPHYATTLAEWRRRFLQSVKAGAVHKAGFDDIFIRKWIYYLTYCESGFATRTLGLLQLVLTRVNNISALKGPPVCAQ